MSTLRTGIRHYWVALRAMAIFAVLLGVAYPVVITAVSQIAFPWHANGSPVSDHGTVVGSALIGQSFADPDGDPLPEWFQSRPSSAGDAGYDAGASSGSNLGPESEKLVAEIDHRKHAIADLEGVSLDAVPVDALTASGSGLDPHISPDYALLQAPRVAEANHLPEQTVLDLVTSKIQGRDLGFLGESSVNVLELNLALKQAKG